MPAQPSLLSTIRKANARTFIPDTVYSGLAAIGCSEPEIATLLGVTKEALAPKADLLAHGRARLKQSLRKAQIKAALRGNASMLIWLGKTYLGQREDPDPSITQQTNIVVDAGLLASLQSSYKATLEDVRAAKLQPLKVDSLPAISPPNKPARLASRAGVDRSTPRGSPSLGELVTPQYHEAYPESQPIEPVVLKHGTVP